MSIHHDSLVYCPKCKSEDVDINEVIDRKSMDELGGYIQNNLFFNNKHNYHAVCRNCGYKRDFIEQNDNMHNFSIPAIVPLKETYKE